MAEREIKIDLKYPVHEGGVQIKTLTMRPPKARDLVAADKTSSGDIERDVHLLAMICGVAPSTIEELDLGDYKRLQDKSQSFLS
jgi:hypothetical protein